MDASDFLLLYLVYGVTLGSFCAYLAGQKGRGAGSWFFLGLIFGILALLVLIGLPGEQRSSTKMGHNGRLCPHCIQEVHEFASACPHCQRDLPDPEHCSYGHCHKIINPTDDRCEDDQGNPYCGDIHRQQNLAECSYTSCQEIVSSVNDRYCQFHQ